MALLLMMIVFGETSVCSNDSTSCRAGVRVRVFVFCFPWDYAPWRITEYGWALVKVLKIKTDASLCTASIEMVIQKYGGGDYRPHLSARQRSMVLRVGNTDCKVVFTRNLLSH